ncbi:MAG TPA: hypothetical protein VNH44_11375 [Micropepsaceae bacterium]|nr:hypothetical protein [Micropepsaceae bacterium]
MNDLDQHTAEISPRRSFFGIAALSALGVFGLATNAARAQPAPSDGPDWPGMLPGRHKQLFDVYTINEGFPLGFVNNFITPNQSATAVMIFRHQGLPYALNSMIWAKYKVGETFKIIDPETKAPAVKNPWFAPKPGVGNPQAALDRLAARGTVMGACGVALRGQSGRLASNAGVTAEEALKEFTANLIPGVTVIPSGTWGVNRAQEAGCTYCAGGSTDGAG